LTAQSQSVWGLKHEKDQREHQADAPYFVRRMCAAVLRFTRPYRAQGEPQSENQGTLCLLFLQNWLGLPDSEQEGEKMSITEETRRDSYYAVLATLTGRHKNILQVLRECGDMTAQEVAGELHRRGITPTDERNFAAPRLTELADMGLVTAVGKKRCYKTGRNVTLWAVTMGLSQ
jgi:hypothetical protein